VLLCKVDCDGGAIPVVVVVDGVDASAPDAVTVLDCVPLFMMMMMMLMVIIMTTTIILK
jgi:hypothetical protein